MALDDIARKALNDIRAAAGENATDGHEAEILAAVDKAMHAAMDLCCAHHAEIVGEHLSHAHGVAKQINDEADRRRNLLITNLSAMR